MNRIEVSVKNARLNRTQLWFALVITLLLVAGGTFAAWSYLPNTTSVGGHSHDHTSCELKQKNVKDPAVAAETQQGEPPTLDKTTEPGQTPAGMVWIPAGEFSMGSSEEMFSDARPIHRVRLKGFWMDKTEVTNRQFDEFVKATGYVTVAERTPRLEDMPGATADDLFAGSIVFSPPDTAVRLDNYFQWWRYIAGANWRHPQGPSTDIKKLGDHPAVHIAYEDAIAYAHWAGGRLPTEAEFEWAARGGLDRKKYTWGDDFNADGKFHANSFQGHFPDTNTAEDGFVTTAPVGSFEPNGFGLFDMAGNVWEWCSDWYRSDYYKTLAEQGVADNPQGPKDSYDPAEPETPKRVHKGGSFLCTDQYCSRYMPGGRGKGDPSTGTNHLGFRIVRDAK
jgi:formylglycine-generating enzyme required for sulfatase activity